MSDYRLPKYFEVNGELFEIRHNGDYRIVLSCFTALNDKELSDYEKSITCLILFYDKFEEIEDVTSCPYINELTEKMFWFFNCGNEYHKDHKGPNLLDWDKDATLITSAINRVAGKDVREEEYIHWWTFMGYYMEIGECLLSQIVSIRYKIAKGKKLEKHEATFQQEHPYYFELDMRCSEQIEADDYVKSLWDGDDN